MMGITRLQSDRMMCERCKSVGIQAGLVTFLVHLGLFFMLMFVMGDLSEAAEWSVQPSLGTRGIYNSNLTLTPRPHDSSYGYWITPAADFSGSTERLEVKSQIAADFIGYFGGRDTQFTNVFVPLSVRYKTEKDLIGFTGGFTRTNTLLNELQETGVVLDFTQRNQLTANPSWTRNLTEKLSFQMGAQFAYTRYDADNPQLVGRLVDYRLVGGSGGLSYQLTERDQIRLTGSYTDFETFAGLFPFQASYPGLSMSVTHAFDESLTGTVYGGPKFLSSTLQTRTRGEVSSSDTVWVTGGTLSKQFERAKIEASIGRDLFPSGFGLLIASNRAEILGSYELSETMTCTLDIVGAFTSGQTESANGGVFRDRRYVSLRPAISWKFQEWMEAELSYMYRRQSSDLLPGEDRPGVIAPPLLAQSHAVMVMFTYIPPKLSFSR